MLKKLSIIIPIQLVIIITILVPFNYFSTFKWMFGWVLLFIILKFSNSISPFTWLLMIWNIIFINAYSGILIYKSPIDYSALLYILLTLTIFATGYFFPSKKSRGAEASIYFEEKLDAREYRIINIFSYISILGGLFIFIDIILISKGNLNNLSTLRLLISDRDVSVFGQLSAIFLSGGFLSLIGILIFKHKTQTVLMLSIISLALASFLTAGRQTIFQIVIITVLLLLIRRRYAIKIKFSVFAKFATFVLVGITIIYLIILSTTRDIVSMDKDKLIGYTNTNKLRYSADFIDFTNRLPIEVTNFIADFTFYFSEEIVVYSDTFIHNDYPIVNFDFLQFFPFFERQLSKLDLRSNTLELRMENASKSNYEPSVFATGWGTSTLTLLSSFGYFGGLIIVFLHGLISKYIYKRFYNKPSFYTILALISNNVILLYTAITPVTQETSFMFFIFISFYLLLIKSNFSKKLVII